MKSIQNDRWWVYTDCYSEYNWCSSFGSSGLSETYDLIIVFPCVLIQFLVGVWDFIQHIEQISIVHFRPTLKQACLWARIGIVDTDTPCTVYLRLWTYRNIKYENWKVKRFLSVAMNSEEIISIYSFTTSERFRLLDNSEHLMILRYDTISSQCMLRYGWRDQPANLFKGPRYIVWETNSRGELFRFCFGFKW